LLDVAERTGRSRQTTRGWPLTVPRRAHPSVRCQWRCRPADLAQRVGRPPQPPGQRPGARTGRGVRTAPDCWCAFPPSPC